MLEIARGLDPTIKQSRDLVKPSSFDTAVQCALTLAGYDEANQSYHAYSTALRVGFAYTELGTVVKNAYIRQHARDKIALVNDFLHLRETEWKVQVTAAAHRQRQERSWKLPKLLPLTEDCTNCNTFLQTREVGVKEITKNGMSTEAYVQLAKVTLAQVILYNRRRPKEVELLTVEHYMEEVANKRPVHDEVLQSLTTLEKVALKRLTLGMVRGKRGRGVPILLPPNLKESMDTLAKQNLEKTYVFSRVADGAATPMRGSQTVSELASGATPKLKHPENIRCTKLRKHLATLSQLLDLKKNELEQLANHMGHDIRTHREYYRLPVETLLLAKMSKLLNLAHEERWLHSKENH